MIDQQLPSADFEAAYELLAAAIDRVGRERESEFLARLALLLMQFAPDEAAVSAALAAAEVASR